MQYIPDEQEDDLAGRRGDGQRKCMCTYTVELPTLSKMITSAVYQKHSFLLLFVCRVFLCSLKDDWDAESDEGEQAKPVPKGLFVVPGLCSG